MNIHETFHFDKEGEVIKYPRFRRYFLTIIIILVALLSFGIGRLTGESREGVKITTNDQTSIPKGNSLMIDDLKIGDSTQGVFASSQGTRYYYSHCKSTVSEKNKVTFATALMAEKAGYTLATNCKPR